MYQRYMYIWIHCHQPLTVRLTEKPYRIRSACLRQLMNMLPREMKLSKSLRLFGVKYLVSRTSGCMTTSLELGGDSINSIQVVSRAKQQGISLTPKDIFTSQTIAGQAKLSQTNKFTIAAEQGTVVGKVKLTPIQTWFFENEFINKNHWNQSIMLEVDKAITSDILKNALDVLIQQHDVLRLRFVNKNNIWEQEYGAVPSHFFEEVDYSSLSGEELKSRIEEDATNAQASLSIETGDLVKTVYFKTRGKNLLLLAIHHLSVDGASLAHFGRGTAKCITPVNK